MSLTRWRIRSPFGLRMVGPIPIAYVRRMVAQSVTRAVSYVATRSVGGPIPAGCHLTLNFHPDALCGQDLMMVRLAREGVYRSQFETGTSNGGLTAHCNADFTRRASKHSTFRPAARRP